MEAGEKAGETVDEETVATREKAWLSSITIGDYPGLEGEITIELSRRCTVLVGKNATGKSLLVDALSGASLVLRAFRPAANRAPGRFECAAQVGERALGLSYARKRKPGRQGVTAPSAEQPTESLSYEEACWAVENGARRPLWHVARGRLSMPRATSPPAAPNVGRLAVLRDDEGDVPADYPLLQSLDHALSFHTVTAGIPREANDRQEIFLRASRYTDGGTVSEARGRLGSLAASLILSEGQPWFERLVEAARRIGIARSIKVIRYGNTAPGDEDAAEPPSEHLAEVQVDGVNLGLASDGTARALEIIQSLIGYPHPLLIEEPETGVHPGLVARLLGEIGSYEGQVIISTHSPQVVSWANPEDIRLVERHDGKTTVRSLTPSEFDRVHEYLSHDGTLGEFVYGGALDGED